MQGESHIRFLAEGIEALVPVRCDDRREIMVEGERGRIDVFSFEEARSGNRREAAIVIIAGARQGGK